MTIPEATVFVVDDDSHVRGSIEQLIKSVGLNVHTFSSAQEFLDQGLPDTPSCLVLDIRMPSLSGLDLQDELVKRGFTTPVIFITGHGTVPMSVRAMKAGAVDFLQKPFEDQDLLDAIHRAIEQNKQTRLEQAEIGEIKRRVESLTPREYEVLVLVVAGMLNKQIAYDLKMSENTVKTHRAHIMQKMQVESLADLVRLTEKVGILQQKG
jgi:FixJ family two-component response regulator